MSKPFKAVAAMARNRVIGSRNRIPWHLPEDFKWFKELTTGNVIVMGRKTYESIGRPLPNRITVVLTRSQTKLPGVLTLSGLNELSADRPEFHGKQIFICGGAEIYRQALPLCSDLYLTLVKSEPQGDVFFPPFEGDFRLVAKLRETPDFEILHYSRFH